MRKFVITVVVLVAVLLGLDRGGAYAASRVLADKIKTQQHLSSEPSVVIHDFPFLTQVAGGSYDRVDVNAHGVVTPELRLDTVHIEAQGIKVALSDLVHGTVHSVPVRQGTATVHLSFADLNAAIHRQVGGIPSVGSSQNGHVTITGRVSAFGTSVAASADAAVSVTSDSLSLLPLASAFNALPTILRGPASSALTIHLGLPHLPFGIKLQSGRISPTGVDLVASVTGAVFPVS